MKSVDEQVVKAERSIDDSTPVIDAYCKVECKDRGVDGLWNKTRGILAETAGEAVNVAVKHRDETRPDEAVWVGVRVARSVDGRIWTLGELEKIFHGACAVGERWAMRVETGKTRGAWTQTG